MEHGRYHLYVSFACPWSSYALQVLKLKGLDKSISFSATLPEWGSIQSGAKTKGWVFEEAKQGEHHSTQILEKQLLYKDPVNGYSSIKQLYQRSIPGYQGLFMLPVLWDKRTHQIVNNESNEIVDMLNTKFNSLATNKIDYRPKGKKDLETFLNEDINMGVYKVGFVRTQSEYEAACKQLFKSLGKLEQILSKQKFVCGSQPTLLDIRLFETLIRFDLVYSTIFKCNHK